MESPEGVELIDGKSNKKKVIIRLIIIIMKRNTERYVLKNYEYTNT